MENYFRGFLVEYIDRNKNIEADELVKAAARKIALPPMHSSKHSKIHQ
jgi:hypothetical protein